MSETLKLDYTAINIENAETRANKSFFDAFGEMSGKPSVSTIAFLMRAGGATDEQINDSFKQGLERCFQVIMAGLNSAGFLGEIDTEAVSKALAKAQAQAKSKSTDTSKTTGAA